MSVSSSEEHVLIYSLIKKIWSSFDIQVMVDLSLGFGSEITAVTSDKL